MLVLRNQMGVMKQVKVGFSWTMLFFGIFVPLVRGDIKWFFLSIIIVAITGGIAWLILPFFYNKAYLHDLMNKGYKVVQ